MEQVNILDARNSLSRLVAAVGDGAEVVIANRGKPVARLVPVTSEQPHTAARLAEWLTVHPVPGRETRSGGQLDQQIAEERQGWE